MRRRRVPVDLVGLLTRSRHTLSTVAKLGDASVQRTADVEIRGDIERQLGVELTPKRLRLSGGASVAVDGVSQDQTVFLEIFAHQGTFKGGQAHKVATDA